MKKFSLIATILAASAGLLFSQNKLVDDPMPQDMKDKIAKACPVKPAASPKKPRKILSFSRTVGWRHNTGILGANEMLSNLSKNLGIFEVVFSDDPAEFEAENLKKYDAVILNNTTQAFLAPSSDPKNPKSVNLKDPEVKAISDRRCQNLIDFVNNGGGVFAIHAGVDCYNYPHNRNKAFTDMIGGEFISHPWGAGNIAETFVIDDTQSPVTKGIWKNDGFKLKDEIYMVGESYDRSKCRVLIRLDEFRSPIPSAFGDGTYPKKPRKVRTDGDIAMNVKGSVGLTLRVKNHRIIALKKRCDNPRAVMEFSSIDVAGDLLAGKLSAMACICDGSIAMSGMINMIDNANRILDRVSQYLS